MRKIQPRNGVALEALSRNFPESSLTYLLVQSGVTDPSQLMVVVQQVAEYMGVPILEPKESPDLVQVIRPKETAPDQSSSGYKTKLRLHTENPGEVNEPDFLVIGCVNNEEKAGTLLADPLAALEHLTPEEIELLQQEVFSVCEAEAFAANAGRSQRAIIARNIPVIKTGIDGSFDFAADFDEMVDVAPTDEHREALLRFEQECERVETSVVLDPGDVLVIKNRKVLHGRTAFELGDDIENRRCLLREFVRSN
ncbi:MAG: TauD/TfdA family dioxygenase [Acidimicrobiia bacterium]